MAERNKTAEVEAKQAEPAEERELSAEELDQVSGGTGIPVTAANSASGSDKAKHSP